MGIRPSAASWFEILTPREQLTRALRCLAKTGAVELQCHSQTTSPAMLPDLSRGLEEFGELSRRYGDWWPKPVTQPVEAVAEPVAQLVDALTALRAWTEEAGPVIAELQGTRRMLGDLETLADAFSLEEERLPNLHQLAAAGPYLEGRLYVLPAEAGLQQAPPSVLLQRIETEHRRYLFAVGQRAQIAALDQQMNALRARPLPLPEWLPPEPGKAREAVNTRVAAGRKADETLVLRLQTVHNKHNLAETLGRLHLLEWYVSHVPELPTTEHFAWITGWTSDLNAENLETELNQKDLNCLLRLGEPPPDVEPPVVLRNPGWARQFELFAGLLGMPGQQDVDPSRLVALMAPLMFGYMFGDVGQGAVLLVLGLLLRKKLPALGLLVPGGISAIVFGFVFGSVFANEHLIAPLWLHPIEQPIPVLAASLIFGVFVVSSGLFLDALQFHWRGEALKFWGARLGLSMTYVGLLSAFWNAAGLWLALLGATWFIVGAGLTERGRIGAAIADAAVEFAELVLQVAVNTISFVRVGAFALAHAGLSAAVIGMAEGFDAMAGKLAVLVFGNALIIGLEGLVVGIQTTRLVLFEFFIRFLRSSGRRFRPLPSPDEPAGAEEATKEHQRRAS